MRPGSLSIGFALVVMVASAQDPPAQDPPAHDPPSRVARLNLIDGQVSFLASSQDTWTGATLNYPLTAGDHLYTDTNSRAELHIGPNAIRLNWQTNFGFLNLDDRTVQMRFTEGAIEIRLRTLDRDDLWEVDTPNGAVSLLRAGDYRIDTDPDRNATMVTVVSGEAEVAANGTTSSVYPRQTAYFADRAPDIRAANFSDAFDRFTEDRNVREDRLPPPRHVSQSMIGYEDLDAYGSWREEPDYGWVWAPPVQADWAPYRNGHWAWIEPWGWTWIDDALWGFAPFHYGRWAFAGVGWVWVPGAIAVHPVYAPALVAFVGGPRFNVGAGAVAWFPLGPREVYRPPYRVSNSYVTNVNITHVTNITNTNNNVTFVNQNVRGAVTAVPQNAFAGGRHVQTAAISVSPQQLSGAQVVSGAPAIAAPRGGFPGSNGGTSVPRPRQTVIDRPVVARTPPPSPRPGPQPAIVRPAPDVRTFPQPRPAPEARPVPQVRPTPEARPFPQGRPAAPEVRPAPEARPFPQARPAPEARPAPPPNRPAGPVGRDRRREEDRK